MQLSLSFGSTNLTQMLLKLISMLGLISIMTKFITNTVINLVTPKVAPKLKLQPTRVKHLLGVAQLGGLLVSPTNTRLGWKGLLGTNTLAYYENP